MGKANVYNTINNEKVNIILVPIRCIHLVNQIDIIIQSRACNIFWSASWCGSNSFKLICTYTTSGTGTSLARGSYIESESELSVANPQWNQFWRFLSWSFKRDNRTHRHSFKRALISFAKPKLRPFWFKQHANDLFYRYIHYRLHQNLSFLMTFKINVKYCHIWLHVEHIRSYKFKLFSNLQRRLSIICFQASFSTIIFLLFKWIKMSHPLC